MATLNFGTDYVPTGMYDLGSFPPNSFVVKYKDPTTGAFGKAAVVQYTDDYSGRTQCGIRIGNTVYQLNGYSTKLGNYYMAFPKNSNLFRSGTNLSTGVMPMPGNTPSAGTTICNNFYLSFSTNNTNAKGNNHALNNLFLELTHRPTQEQFVFDDTLAVGATNYYSSYKVSTNGTKTIHTQTNGIIDSNLIYNPLGSLQINQLNAKRSTMGPVYDVSTLTAANLTGNKVTYFPYATQNLLFSGEYVSMYNISSTYPNSAEGNATSSPESLSFNIRLVNSRANTDGYTFSNPLSATTDFKQIYNIADCTTNITNFSAAAYCSLYGLSMRDVLGLIYVKFADKSIKECIILSEPNTGQFLTTLQTRIEIVQSIGLTSTGESIFVPLNLDDPNVDLGWLNARGFSRIGFLPSNHLIFGVDYIPTGAYDPANFPQNSFIVKCRDPITKLIIKTPVLSTTIGSVTSYSVLLNKQEWKLPGYSTHLSDYYVTGDLIMAYDCPSTGGVNGNYTNSGNVTQALPIKSADMFYTPFGTVGGFGIQGNAGIAFRNKVSISGVTITDVGQSSMTFTADNYTSSNSITGAAFKFDVNGNYTITGPSSAAFSSASFVAGLDSGVADLYTPASNIRALLEYSYAGMFYAFGGVAKAQEMLLSSTSLMSLVLGGEKIKIIRNTGGAYFYYLNGNASLPANVSVQTWDFRDRLTNTSSYSNTTPVQSKTIAVSKYGLVFGAKLRASLININFNLTNPATAERWKKRDNTGLFTIYAYESPNNGQFLVTDSSGNPILENGKPLRVELIYPLCSVGSGLSLAKAINVEDFDLSYIKACGFTPIYPPDGSASIGIAAAITSIESTMTRVVNGPLNASLNTSIASLVQQIAASKATVDLVTNAVKGLNDPIVTKVITDTTNLLNTANGYLKPLQDQLNVLSANYNQLNTDTTTAPADLLNKYQALVIQCTDFSTTVANTVTDATNTLSRMNAQLKVAQDAASAATTNVGELKVEAEAATNAAQCLAGANEVDIYTAQVKGMDYQGRDLELQFNQFNATQDQIKAADQTLAEIEAFFPLLAQAQATSDAAVTAAQQAVIAAQGIVPGTAGSYTNAETARTTTVTKLAEVTQAVQTAISIRDQAQSKLWSLKNTLVELKKPLIGTKLTDIQTSMMAVGDLIPKIEAELTKIQASATAAAASLNATNGLADTASIGTVVIAKTAIDKLLTEVKDQVAKTKTELTGYQMSLEFIMNSLDLTTINILSVALPKTVTDLQEKLKTFVSYTTTAEAQAKVADTAAKTAQTNQLGNEQALENQAQGIIDQMTAMQRELDSFVTMVSTAVSQAQGAKTLAALYVAYSPDIVKKIDIMLAGISNPEPSIATARQPIAAAIKLATDALTRATTTPNDLPGAQEALKTVLEERDILMQSYNTAKNATMASVDKGNQAQALVIEVVLELVQKESALIDPNFTTIQDNIKKLQDMQAQAKQTSTDIKEALKQPLTAEVVNALQASDTVVTRELGSITTMISSLQSNLNDLEKRVQNAEKSQDIGLLRTLKVNVSQLLTTASQNYTTAQTSSNLITEAAKKIPAPQVNWFQRFIQGTWYFITLPFVWIANKFKGKTSGQ